MIAAATPKASATAVGATDTMARHQQPCRTGTTSFWRNPDSGYAGTFTPTRTFRSASGQDCREFQTTVTVGSREEDATGRACRQSDGTWRFVQ